MSNPFAYNPPSLGSSAQSPPASISSSASSTSLDADASIEGFYSLLLASPEMDSPVIKYLANRLLDLRIRKSLRVELSALGGELRDEWKVRVGGVKADWMARIIPEPEGEEKEEEVHGGLTNGAHSKGTGSVTAGTAASGDDLEASEPLPPTILSNVDDMNLMSKRVDSVVEQEFEDRLTEAEVTLRKGVVSKEKLELEIFLGELVSLPLYEKATTGSDNLPCSYWKHAMKKTQMKK